MAACHQQSDPPSHLNSPINLTNSIQIIFSSSEMEFVVR